jgi:hypothetical protein
MNIIQVHIAINTERRLTTLTLTHSKDETALQLYACPLACLCIGLKD